MMPRGFHDDDGFRKYLAAIQRFPRLDRKTEQKLARRWRRRGDKRAADALVESHLRYVVKIATQYRGYGFRLADLVEEGNLGLLEAATRFDPARNLRFMTYAAYWIRAYILAHVLKQWSLVGVGTGPLQSKMFFRLARERSHLAALPGAPLDQLVLHPPHRVLRPGLGDEARAFGLDAEQARHEGADVRCRLGEHGRHRLRRHALAAAGPVGVEASRHVGRGGPQIGEGETGDAEAKLVGGGRRWGRLGCHRRGVYPAARSGATPPGPSARARGGAST